MKKLTVFMAVLLTVLLLFVASGCVYFVPIIETFVAWVVGSTDENGKAMLLYTPDSGFSWVRQAMDVLPEGVNLNNVLALDQQVVWAIGDARRVLSTINGGITWNVSEVLEIEPDRDLFSISVFDGDIWISGDHGLILRSIDQGNTWTVFEQSATVQEYLLQGIYAINHQIVYAVGNKATGRSGVVVRTLDGGVTWEEITLPNNYLEIGWIGVKAVDTEHIVLFGGKGHYAVTANGGAQWVTGGPLSTRDLNDLVMLNQCDYWAACDFDSIIRTKNSGISWEEQPSAGTSNSFLVGIAALSPYTALITGRSAGYPPFGKILKTVDGGVSWQSVYETNTSLDKVTIAAK
jgi:photosystem II stability/assembly factor-like uncharacterized protein